MVELTSIALLLVTMAGHREITHHVGKKQARLGVGREAEGKVVREGCKNCPAREKARKVR